MKDKDSLSVVIGHHEFLNVEFIQEIISHFYRKPLPIEPYPFRHWLRLQSSSKAVSAYVQGVDCAISLQHWQGATLYHIKQVPSSDKFYFHIISLKTVTS